ncbi:UDP-N-acetylglucosamine transporter UGNT1-like isoform X2 [Phaseolus vulgaris]|uniref:UDP-N-acetylglucosamine transporter UGNT1-like isoform X2 n=1 Tax=Phaseolus vulgaris TaxID=3885 RepID=UPI0035CA0110
MSLKPSNSSQNLMLPVSNPPSNQNDYADDKLFRGSAMTKRGAFAAASYMSCAGAFLPDSAPFSHRQFFNCFLNSLYPLSCVVLLVMFNKAALSSYNFPSANVITLLQMVCSCCFLYLLRRWRMISFTANESLLISDNSTKFVSLKTLKHTFPLSGAYLFYMLVTMESVRGVNVPMYTTLRRTTVVFTMLVEFALVGQRYTPSVILSVGLIVFGAFVAGARDFSFDAYGYAVVFMSNIATAIYLATISRIGKTSGLNSFGLMWCNGIICGPVLLIWTFVRGDLKTAINFPYLFSPGFIVILLFSCILAFFLNYFIFLNTTLNSAVTQTICGNLKDLFTIGLGWIIFGGLPFDIWNVSGQFLGFAGSGLYAYYKLIGK